MRFDLHVFVSTFTAPLCNEPFDSVAFCVGKQQDFHAGIVVPLMLTRPAENTRRFPQFCPKIQPPVVHADVLRLSGVTHLHHVRFWELINEFRETLNQLDRISQGRAIPEMVRNAPLRVEQLRPRQRSDFWIAIDW